MASNYKICNGEFALCAASSATPTGKNIEVNTANGKVPFPEAVAVCPVLRGFTAASDPDVFVQLPKLVNLAERRAARELKIQGFQTVVTATMQAGLAVYPKPTRWRQTISVNWGSGTLNNTRNILYPRRRSTQTRLG